MLILFFLLAVLVILSFMSSVASTALRHNGSIIGKTPSDPGWNYKKTPAYKLGLTRLHVYVLWCTGLWGPYLLFRFIKNSPARIIEAYASDKEALEIKKWDELEEREKKIEEEYKKTIVTFDDWDKIEEGKNQHHLREQSRRCQISHYDTL